jgi:hypothetical protein
VTALEERELRDALATVYTPEGVDIWIADAKKKGLSFEKAMGLIIALQEGVFQ